MGKDQITSTDRAILYRVDYSPYGETRFVEAGNATTAQQKGIGIAALEGIKWTGLDVYKASENDMTDYFGEEE